MAKQGFQLKANLAAGAQLSVTDVNGKTHTLKEGETLMTDDLALVLTLQEHPDVKAADKETKSSKGDKD